MNSADACAGGAGGSLGVRRNRPNAAGLSGGANASDTCAATDAATHTPPKSAFDVLKSAAANVKAAPGGPEPVNDNGTNTSACATSSGDRICSNAAAASSLPQRAPAQAADLQTQHHDNDTTAQQQLSRALAELDRERTKRAEAETRCATLSFDARRLRSDAIILRRQRDAFVDMVESLTADSCDAVLYASSRSEDESTLSLHDIRLLEIMPWDERVREVAEVLEEVYEWQVYDGAEGRWTNHTEMFPADFRSLPVQKPCPAGTTTAASSDNAPSQKQQQQQQQNFQGFVLTDRNCTHILDLEGGYPLPSAGSTWRWIGGWRVELQHPCGTPCDEGGWTYCNLPQLLVSNAPGAVFGSPSPPSLTDAGHTTRRSSTTNANAASAPSPSPPKLQFRRRRWTRLRVLLSYPSMSARTEACLDLMAENAILDLKAAKMEDYAHRMMEIAREKDEMNRKLRRRLRSTEAALHALEREKIDAGIDDTIAGSHDSMKKIAVANAYPTPSMSSSSSPTPSSSQNTKRRWSLSFPLTLSSASSPKPIYAISNTNNSAHGIPSAPVLEDDDSNDHCENASSSSQDTTYSTDPNSSEDEVDSGTEAGTSMRPISAKSIAEKACQNNVGAPTAASNSQWANHHAVHGVINGARRSIDEGGAFLGRMLRPKVPTELRGNLGKIQLDDEDIMCAGDCEEGGEPFRIPGGGSPTVSY